MNAPALLHDMKQAPYSFEAEQSVLGGLLLEANAWDDISVIVATDDFYSKPHRIIFDAIKGLVTAGLHIDLVMLNDSLDESGKLEAVGGFAYLVEIVRITPSAANITAYARIVKERAVTRALISIGNEIVESGYSMQGATAAELTIKFTDKLDTLLDSGSSDKKYDSMHEMLERAVTRIEENFNRGSHITGLSSGFDDLDKMTAGFQPSDLIIVAARPSMGKTTFAMNLADHAAQSSGKPALVFSMEMPQVQIINRLLSANARVEHDKIKSGNLDDDDWARLSNGMGLMISKTKMIIDDDSGLTPADVRYRARRVHKECGGLSMIMIDYLQLMRVPELSGNRTLEIAEISRSLKSLAKELDIPIIALSQLNRSLEQRADKRPINSDLRESGSIEQDADVIMFIYRDEVYHDDSPDKGIAEIIIGKQRNGPIGKVRLTFQGQYSRFDSYAGPSMRDDY
ncbi:replicative DNA helicase [uncultured Tolumonas sp.]|uniref:replicative DNA helicase n=1 Tax=uncultured Tolumonas sp. TaxID=263765 RepID=UPI002A0A6E3F|nr:replicative DNA helicase [uncultured Tolumonas sp.]